MTDLQELVKNVGVIIEFFGGSIIAAGSLTSTIWFLANIRRQGLEDAYRGYRRIFGHSIILGLDFLIAGDIVRTVIVSPTVKDVVVLAVIVLIRAFLSLTFELGIRGKLPWRTDEE